MRIESGPGHRGARTLALALLGAMGVLVSARPARAVGCHAPDRPRLGMVFSIARPEGSDAGLAARPDPRFAPRPCSGDVPGAPQRAAPEGVATAATRVAGPAVPEAQRLVPASSLALPRLIPSRPDRPPRPIAQ